MTRYFSDDDQADELEYEPFDDVEWTDPDELDAIDLDALDLDELDDAIPGEESVERSGDEAGIADQAAAPRTPSPRRLRSSRPRRGSRRGHELAQGSTPETEPDADSEPEAEAAPQSESAADTAGESTETRAPDAEPAPEAEPDAAPDTAPASDVEAGDAAAEETTDVTAETTPDTPTGEPAAEKGAEPAEVVDSGEAEAPPEPEIPPDVYCAVLALPPEVGAGVSELRITGEITEMPPPGVILTPRFRALDIDAVKTALADWVRIHLPIQLEITGIEAKTIDAQQYIAAWLLEPQEELQESIHTLKRALAELILPLGGTTETVGPHVMIGEHVPARRYVHLIGRMQREFEPQVWQSAELQLVRREPDDQPDGDSDIWHVAQVFD